MSFVALHNVSLHCCNISTNRKYVLLALELQIQWRLGALADFSPANPTGSYVLHLSTDVDHSLAARLLTCWAVETRQGFCKASDLQVHTYHQWMYRTSTKYWFSEFEFSGLVDAFFGAVGTGSIFSVDRHFVPLRYSVLEFLIWINHLYLQIIRFQSSLV